MNADLDWIWALLEVTNTAVDGQVIGVFDEVNLISGLKGAPINLLNSGTIPVLTDIW